MPIKVRNSTFQGIYIIEAHKFIDNRGDYLKVFEKYIFKEYGIPTTYSELSIIKSKIGSLRGLHYQTIEPQGKLVFVAEGSVFDVAIDLRKNSKTFGMAHCIYLDASDMKALYIPAGFAHGFLTLEDNTIFCYQSTGKYLPEHAITLSWNDKSLKILWPAIKNQKYIISEKDSNGISLNDFIKKEACL